MSNEDQERSLLRTQLKDFFEFQMTFEIIY